MAGNDVFLYSVPSDANPNDVRLTDPTQLSSSSIIGSGILVAGAAIVLGIALSISTGTGSLSTQAATIAGEGTVSSALVITGEGALVSQSASLSGAGLSTSTGTGALTAQAATLSGVGAGISTGTGVLLSQAAVASGAGSVYWLARSEPYLNENGVDHYLIEDGTGRYAIEEVRIIAGSAQISGVGITGSTGTGDLLSDSAIIFSQEPPPPIVVTDQPSNWQADYWKYRTKKQRKEDEDEERIRLGILPPREREIADEAVQTAITASQRIVAAKGKEVGAYLLDTLEARQAYDAAYKRSYKEAYVAEVVAENWKADLKRAQRNRAVALLLLH